MTSCVGPYQTVPALCALPLRSPSQSAAGQRSARGAQAGNASLKPDSHIQQLGPREGAGSGGACPKPSGPEHAGGPGPVGPAWCAAAIASGACGLLRAGGAHLERGSHLLVVSRAVPRERLPFPSAAKARRNAPAAPGELIPLRARCYPLTSRAAPRAQQFRQALAHGGARALPSVIRGHRKAEACDSRCPRAGASSARARHVTTAGPRWTCPPRASPVGARQSG